MAANFCPNCGTQTNGANFCPNCGTKINDSAPTVKSTPPPAVGNLNGSGNQDMLKRFGFHTQNSSPPSKPTQPRVRPEQHSKEKPVPAETEQESPLIVKPAVPAESITQNDKKKLLDEIVNEPVIPDSSSSSILKGPRIKRPEKKVKSRPSIVNSFLSAGYDDEANPEDHDKVKIIQDDLYNKSSNDYIEYEEDNEAPAEKAPKKRTRSANTTGRPVSRTNPAIVQKATNLAAKHLIDEDRTLGDRQKVYIIEQDEIADPNDPTYDGYYENIIPIDESAKKKAEEQGKKFTINAETKKTLLILGGLLVALIVVLIVNF